MNAAILRSQADGCFKVAEKLQELITAAYEPNGDNTRYLILKEAQSLADKLKGELRAQALRAEEAEPVACMVRVTRPDGRHFHTELFNSQEHAEYHVGIAYSGSKYKCEILPLYTHSAPAEGCPVDGACLLCGEMTDSLAANPGQWPLLFSLPDGSGRPRPHHVKCVQERIYTQPPAEGWQLVPKEPTEAMLGAAGDYASRKEARRFYLDMLAAAPKE